MRHARLLAEETVVAAHVFGLTRKLAPIWWDPRRGHGPAELESHIALVGLDHLFAIHMELQLRFHPRSCDSRMNFSAFRRKVSDSPFPENELPRCWRDFFKHD
jgi:hypothetical protein